jgi:sugar/nucleoside kinase (ribokinase family)
MKNDVFGLGHPLMDIIAFVDDEFLIKHNLNKGLFHPAEHEDIKKVLSELEDYILTAGDSTANTLTGITNIGGKSIYYGSIGNDEYGTIFQKTLEKENVKTKLFTSEYSTGIALCLVTKDGQRTFLVHLGAALNFNIKNIDENDIINSKVVHITGYQIDDLNMRIVAIHIKNIAKKNNVLVSFDFADPGVVKRNYDFILDFLKDVDIIFANEEEAKAFTNLIDPLDSLNFLNELCNIVIVKIGSKGSYISYNGAIITIEGVKAQTIDTTGAGDMYAAGILYGLTNDMNIENAGNLASYIAAKIVEQKGARFSEKIDVSQFKNS